jgi:hypothetical protein
MDPMQTLLRLARKILAVTIGFFFVATAAIMAVGWTAAVVIKCADSATLRNKAKKSLTPEELETLHPADGLCSDVYVFKRDGENQCVMLDSDGLGCG